MNNPNQEFTKQQLYNWKKFEEVRSSGEYNMFDSQAIESTGLSKPDYLHVISHYKQLKEAFEEFEDNYYDNIYKLQCSYDD
jgi:hypothetical protein